MSVAFYHETGPADSLGETNQVHVIRKSDLPGFYVCKYEDQEIHVHQSRLILVSGEKKYRVSQHVDTVNNWLNERDAVEREFQLHETVKKALEAHGFKIDDTE